MSRFRFPLAMLLRVGEARLAAARREAQAAAGRLAQWEAAEKKARERREHADHERDRRLRNGVTVYEMVALERHADGLRPGERMTRRALEEADAERRQAMLDLTAAHRKVRTLEDLRRRARRRHLLHESRRLQKEADELHVLRRLHEERT